MKINHTFTYSKKAPLQFQVTDDLRVTIHETSNPFGLEMSDLFQMAARINKKRSFLFVSKLLGKHIPVEPTRALHTGALLAALIQKEKWNKRHPQIDQMVDSIKGKKGKVKETVAPIPLTEPHLFIGFAETATALGHSVFEHFQNAYYVHSTREMVAEQKPTFEFQEEHSHATDQICYGEERLFQNQYPIVLVDDEITTGKTALNIIESLHGVYPRKEYTVVSILDWRSESNRNQFKEVEERLGISIHVVSLYQGTIEVQGTPELTSSLVEEWVPMKEPSIRTLKVKSIFPYQSKQYTQAVNAASEVVGRSYLSNTGRFGLNQETQHMLERSLQKLGAYLAMTRKGKKTLCLGTGEFMYIPMKAASYMGGRVWYQSTTRSPIHPLERPEYGVQNAYRYASPEDPSIQHYFYNIAYEQYDEIYVFMEHGIRLQEDEPFLQQLKQTGVQTIHFVDFS